MTTRPRIPPERTELHNASIDDDVGAAGRCGLIHLPTGRICIREHPHGGSCELAAADKAHDLAALKPPLVVRR
jgi:hypothetical protein